MAWSSDSLAERVGQHLLHLLQDQPQIKRLLIAYSGGLDSHVLLHLLASYPAITHAYELQVIHVNHGLQLEALQWSEHCQQQATELNLPIEIIKVHVSQDSNQSLETAARDARYGAFALCMQPDTCLITAHHKDDQAETLLLRLLRGAGPKGLAAMQVLKPFKQGLHARPLLDVTRTQLVRYAEQEKLHWVDDSSNQDPSFDRNYLRHHIMPLLQQRWPGSSNTFARTASLCLQQNELLHSLLAEDLQTVLNNKTQRLSICELKKLTYERQCYLLRYWVEASGHPLPSQAQLHQVIDNVVASREDAVPLVCWKGTEIRRYRDELFVLSPMENNPVTCEIDWQPQQGPCLLPSGHYLHADKVMGQGIKFKDKFKIKFRRGGERIRPAGRQGSRCLKKLMQEWGIPPWERACVPLIYDQDQLVAVAGYCVAEDYSASKGEIGISLKITSLSEA